MDDYTITDDRHNDRLIATRSDQAERLIFPYRWDGRYIFTYRSRDRPTPAIVRLKDGVQIDMEMDRATFAIWKPRLEQWRPEGEDPPSVIDDLVPPW